jgi:NAD(P)-dependent dehydrogenase (short-subunit alcohol dehydrogenase family)
MNDPAFKDKVVIITGGLSGIGRELAHQLADQGAWLCTGSPECRAHGSSKS